MALKKVTVEQIDRLRKLCATDPLDNDEVSDIFGEMQIAVSARSKNIEREPEAVRQFVAVTDVMDGINGEGFLGMFNNVGPGPVRDARAFLSANGFGDVVRVLDAAIAALPGGALPDTFDELEEMTAEPDPDVEEALSDIEDRYHELAIDSERLNKQLALHVIAHANEFLGTK